MIEEHLQVLLHLDGVVFHLRDGEDAHLAVLPGSVLFQQERKQHQHAAIVYDPPDVNIARYLDQSYVLNSRGGKFTCSEKLFVIASSHIHHATILLSRILWSKVIRLSILNIIPFQ